MVSRKELGRVQLHFRELRLIPKFGRWHGINLLTRSLRCNFQCHSTSILNIRISFIILVMVLELDLREESCILRVNLSSILIKYFISLS